jgi:hypothetical protein
VVIEVPVSWHANGTKLKRMTGFVTRNGTLLGQEEGFDSLAFHCLTKYVPPVGRKDESHESERRN